MKNPSQRTRSGQVIAADGRIAWEPETRGMRLPVECRCGKIYDIGHVTVIARYADCDMWNCPRCGAQSDNRPWVHQPYKKLGRA